MSLSGSENAKKMTTSFLGIKIEPVLQRTEEIFKQYLVPTPDLADRAKVIQLRQKFARSGQEKGLSSMKEASEIFQAAIMECIHRYGWFGPGWQVTYSPFDDLCNGIDVLLRQGNGSDISLALDLKMSGLAIGKEIPAIAEKISAKGRMAFAKYPAKGLRPLTEVPLCIVGCGAEIAQDFLTAWLRAPADGRDIKDHPIRYVFLQQAIEQLAVFRELASHRRYDIAVQKYSDLIALLQRANQPTVSREAIASMMLKDSVAMKINESLGILKRNHLPSTLPDQQKRRILAG